MNGHLQFIQTCQAFCMDKIDLDHIDHIALQVDDIGLAAEWYKNTFNCIIEYQDETWAMLSFFNIKIALVISAQHPPHIAICRHDAVKFGKLKTHRDGTESCYVSDPSKNILEVLKAQ